MKRFKLLFFILLLGPISVSGQSDAISAALKTGNTAKLMKHLADKIDLVILNDDVVVSKSDAKKKLDDFFSGHKPTSFQVLHNGESGSGMQYTIGKLSTSNGNFRVSYYVKNDSKSPLIHQLMIDPD